MRHLPVCLFLVMGLTAVNGQYFCNGGTFADPNIRCAQGQHVYCCDTTLVTAEDPSRKQGFPTYSDCGTKGATCTVKDNSGLGLLGFAACC
ncbi:hypothetical protein CDEST_00132 [Colletotrichum destructivum]|uniref:Uncharacterized protein n=1 Tax=Colletotrichum destructivum TaxID=34406 RepID=A0AAX4HW77_9PEZI|nr:hypothetical protein CDEST_00132 [Colletotrichum destructivum]